MAKTLEFFFDFGSPTTYLAFTQVEPLAQRLGARVAYKPMLLGGVFKATGNASPITVPAKGAWMTGDLKRWAEFYRVSFQIPPSFPINTLMLMRGAVACLDTEKFDDYLHAVFKAMWADGRDLADPAVVESVVRDAGIDPDEFAAWIGDPAVKEALKARTDEAVARGVFGAPTMFVGEEMFFGQDRLHFVGEALSKTEN